MHMGVKFNIVQSSEIVGWSDIKRFVVIDGQRTNSGMPASGAKKVSVPMSRDEAIREANLLDSEYLAALLEAVAHKPSVDNIAEALAAAVLLRKSNYQG